MKMLKMFLCLFAVIFFLTAISSEAGGDHQRRGGRRDAGHRSNQENHDHRYR